MLRAQNRLELRLLSPVLFAAWQSHNYPGLPVPPACPPPVQKGECHVNFIRKVRLAGVNALPPTPSVPWAFRV